MTPPMRFAPLGDAALTLTLGDAISLDVHASVVRAADRIRAARLPSMLDIVPAYTAVTVYYDPLRTDCATMQHLISTVMASEGPTPQTIVKEQVIPVQYDGPDLAAVAHETGISVSEVVARHAAPLYEVCVIGFVPGFAYLGPLDPTLILPRLSTPRRRVPAGSVAIAGCQTGVYPFPTPGGWRLLGHTDVTLFDVDRDPPALLAAGDRVRFEAL